MSDHKNLDPRLSRVYANPGDKRAMFDDWADTYDHDLVNDLGYVADAVAVDKLLNLVPDRTKRVLDMGCGTGLVGRRLKDAGFIHVNGNDYSQGMLDKAHESGVYEDLELYDATKPVNTPGIYDVCICVGVFAFSIPNAQHLVNPVNSVRPGAPAIVTVNGKAWREKNWEQQLEEFFKANKDIQLDSLETIGYLTAENIDGRLLVLRKQSS